MENKTLDQLKKEFAELKALYEAESKWLEYYEAAKKAGTATAEEESRWSVIDMELTAKANQLERLDTAIRAIRGEKSAALKAQCYEEIIQRIYWLLQTPEGCDHLPDDYWNAETKEFITDMEAAMAIMNKYKGDLSKPSAWNYSYGYTDRRAALPFEDANGLKPTAI
jgi:hypothetical protein